MKNNISYISILIVILFSYKVQAQYFTWTTNPRLLAQVTTNNVVRMTSLDNFRESFKKQREWYEGAKKDMTNILATHEFIYEQLYNVNSLFKQGRKVRYINDYLLKIIKELDILLENSYRNAKYAHVTIKYYGKVMNRINDLGQGLKTIVEKNKEYSEDVPIDEGIEISNIKEIIIGYTDIFEKNYYYNKFKKKNGKFNQVGECGIFDQNRTEENKVKISK